MEANPVRVIQYFDGTKQSVIPLFQRPYTWDQTKWSTLWQDLLAQYDLGGNDTTHFMGAVVSVPAKSVPVGVSKYLVVDGQQRLTTIALLLCALRQYVTVPDQGKIEDYLINRHYQGADRLKLLPTHGDREAYSDLVLEGVLPNHGRLRQAVAYFQKCIEGLDLNGEPIKPQLVLQTIEQCLQVVMINLSDTDDPYLIFESLNYKGEPLTQADLVRNYVLMRFKHSLQAGGEQEQVYFKVWKPMQDLLGDALTDFLRHYAMKDGDEIKQGGIYAAIKMRLGSLRESSEVEAEVLNMKRHAEFYRSFVTPSMSEPASVQRRLQAFIDIDSTTCYPLLLRLFDSRQRGAITESELEGGLAVLESFLVRRILCGLPTNALNKIFPQLTRYYQEHDVVNWLANSLTVGTGPRRWPSDEELEQAILSQPQYGRKATKYVLSTIEKAFEHKEPIDFEKAMLTIEHVLPQTLNSEWQEALGPNFERIHARAVDTLGNLTLTGYNYELGNMPFSDKRKMFAESHLEMNRWIGEQAKWDEQRIEQRAKGLVQRSLVLWPGPSEEEDLSITAQVLRELATTDLKTGGWEPNSAICDLYQRLRDEKWHSRSELEQIVAGRAIFEDRLAKIRRRGTKRNLWILHEKEGAYRLQFRENGAAAANA